MTRPNVETVRRLTSGAQLPCQLIIKHGKLVRKDGKPAVLDFPDGIEVNVVPHHQLVRILDDAWLSTANKYKTWTIKQQTL